jgi:hypothetical protein
MIINRRQMLHVAALSGGALGLGEFLPLLSLKPVSAEDTVVTPDIVRFGPDIEPVVRLIEETSKDKCIAVMVEQIRKGLPYRNFLAALFLAALRSSGLAHNVLVIHGAHQLSLDAPEQERLLPGLWALVNLKYWQEEQKHVPKMEVLTGELPAAEKAAEEFRLGMDKIDADRAERAVVALARAQGTGRALEILWPYGAVNCLSIYHSAIGISNCSRALNTIGWQHGELMLRWLVRSFVDAFPGVPLTHRGDWTYRENKARVAKVKGKLPAAWATAGADEGRTRELLGLIVEAKGQEACDFVLQQLVGGKTNAGAVLDAVHLAAADLLMRKSDVGYPLHSNTGSNAIHQGFMSCVDDDTKLLLLLQSVGWQCHARKRLSDLAQTDPRHKLRSVSILDLDEIAIDENAKSLGEEIFATLVKAPDDAARKVFTIAKRRPDSTEFQQVARRMLSRVGERETHDIKYPVAVFENCEQVSACWRPHVLASSVYWLPDSTRPDPEWHVQAIDALRRLK